MQRMDAIDRFRLQSLGKQQPSGIAAAIQQGNRPTLDALLSLSVKGNGREAELFPFPKMAVMGKWLDKRL